MKTNLAKTILVTLLMTATAQTAQADKVVGLQASDLKIDCTGELVITSVSNVHKIGGLVDRAGNFHPPTGAATLHSKAQNISLGCEVLKHKYNIDVMQIDFNQYFSSASTDLAVVTMEAQKKFGEVKTFKAEQYFSYKEANGYLPFFPLLHNESIKIDNFTMNVDESKAYDIYLSSTDKVQLTELIFAYIQKHGLKDKISSQLLYPLVQNAPQFEKDFKAYLIKLLPLFKEIEEAHVTPEDFSNYDFDLSTLAQGINTLTHNYPQYYAFKMVEMIAEHPSLVSSNSKFPNISAQTVELLIDAIEKHLAAGTMHPNVKAAYKKPLKEMAGHYSPSSQLAELSSKYTELKAKEILKTYY